MRITVFTSNQPRHLGLIERLAPVADEIFAVQECSTVFPGQVDDFFRRSAVMQDYFARVIEAERSVFGIPRFLPANVRQVSVKMGDVSRLDRKSLGDALRADLYLVFGASFIRGPLCEHLVANKAINLHMGVSPYYRGSSTNFWAMYDRRPQFVGATVHRLSRGLDSGPMLFHAFPSASAVDPFVYGMQCVRAAHIALVDHVRQGDLSAIEPVLQDRSKELRYSRNAEFTDEVAAAYLNRLPSALEMESALQARDPGLFHMPHIIQ
jgi:folate-dependent phosphoribosylglycinamide formyltransferase PurN